MYEEVRKGIINKDGSVYMEQFEDKVNPVHLTTEYREAIDIFPALHKYKIEHTTDNLKKLCVEISEFCRAVYSSTQNEQEREIFFDTIKKISRR